MDEDTTATVAENAGEAAEEKSASATGAAETATAGEAGAELTEEQKATAEADRKAQEAKDHKAKTEARINQRISLAKAEAAKDRLAKEQALADKHKAELEAAELRGRLAAHGGDKVVDPNAPPVKPKMEDFETNGEFLAANTEYLEKRQDWLIDNDRKERKQWEDTHTPRPVETPEQTREREIVKNIESTMDKVREEFGDEAVEILTSPTNQTDFRCTPLMRDAILEKESAPKILGYFAENAEVSARISNMSPAQQVREIDKLEQTLNAKKSSSAPAPVTQVAGRAALSEDALPDDTEALAARLKKR
jgi:hypothetical protein